MNKIAYIFASAALLALGACTSKPAEETTTPQSEADEPSSEYVAPVSEGGKVIELTDSKEYAPGVKVSQLTVLDFNAVWCGPCRQLTPVIEELAVKYEGKVTFVSVDVDKNGDLFEAYNLGTSIPVVLFLYPDGSKNAYTGTGDLLPVDKFEALIDAALAK